MSTSDWANGGYEKLLAVIEVANGGNREIIDRVQQQVGRGRAQQIPASTPIREAHAYLISYL